MIKDRNLPIGTILHAKFKGVDYGCVVVEGKEGMVFRLDDGRDFRSPSAAGSAITGTAVNGWTFFSVAPEAAHAANTAKKASGSKRKAREIPEGENHFGLAYSDHADRPLAGVEEAAGVTA